jgi:membrane protease YdiL (CAAX protease family)
MAVALLGLNVLAVFGLLAHVAVLSETTTKFKWTENPWILPATLAIGNGIAIAFACSRSNQTLQQIAGPLSLPPKFILPIFALVGSLVVIEATLYLWLIRFIPSLQVHETYGMDKSRLAAGLSIILVAPLAEELLFRGILLRGLIPNYGYWKGIAIGGALFAIMHIDPARLLGTFAIGVLFGWWFAKTHNIWMGVLGHALNNTLAYVTMWIWPDAADEKIPPYDPLEPLWLLAAAIIFTASLFWMRHLFRAKPMS